MRQFFIFIFALALVFLMSIQDAYSQRWNRYRKEVGISIGASGMLSDLGGARGAGSRYGDFQAGASQYAFGVFGKYRIHDRFAVKMSLFYAKLYGDDALTENADRRSRNLNALTDLVEFSGQLEFYIIKERIGTRYKLRGVKGYGSTHFSLYVFAGLGGAYYSPQGANQAGEWMRLAPLNTEGQGLENGPKDYNQFAVVIPFGVALKYNISKSIGVQFELSQRLTTTDYLDDASTQYYDGDALGFAYGDVSKQLADKRYNYPNRHEAGGTRGHSDKNDAYMFGMISLTYRIRSRARSRVRL